MRALSLKQPWAWLVVHAGKDLENRPWTTKLRGEFLLHAAKGMTRDEYDDALSFADHVLGKRIQCPAFYELERGGIVGVAELFGVFPPWKSMPEEVLLNERNRWHAPDQYGFRLRNVRPLPFLACKGALGFWGHFQIRDGKAVQL